MTQPAHTNRVFRKSRDLSAYPTLDPGQHCIRYFQEVTWPTLGTTASDTLEKSRDPPHASQHWAPQISDSYGPSVFNLYQLQKYF